MEEKNDGDTNPVPLYTKRQESISICITTAVAALIYSIYTHQLISLKKYNMFAHKPDIMLQVNGIACYMHDLMLHMYKTICHNKKTLYDIKNL